MFLLYVETLKLKCVLGGITTFPFPENLFKKFLGIDGVVKFHIFKV